MVIVDVVGVSPIIDTVVILVDAMVTGIGDGNDHSSVLQVEVVGMIGGQSRFI